MRQLRLLSLLLPVLVCKGYQISNLAPNQQNQKPRHTVTGTVANFASGEPIHRALVQMYGGVTATVLTGPDGRFQFPDVPEGPLSFNATKPGYFDPRSVPGTKANPDSFVFNVGSGKNDFRLALLPAAHIVGHLTDRDGEPIHNASVQAMILRIADGRKQWQNVGNGNTDEDGAYRMDNLIPGRYLLFASGHALPPTSFGGPMDATVPAYYPDATDTASAQPIDLKPGQEVRADFRLKGGRGYHILGRVNGIPGQGGVGFSVQNMSGQQVQMEGTRFDPVQGLFDFYPVPPGTWVLEFIYNDGQGRNYETRQEITVNRTDITGLQVQLHPMAQIPVTVNHAATQSSQAGAGETMYVRLISDNPFTSHQFSSNLQGDPPTMSISNVTAGKYRVAFQASGTECVESAWYGNVDVLRDPLVVGSDGGAQALTINMRKDCATLSAKPKSGRGGGVLLVTPSSGQAEPKIVQILPQGSPMPLGFSGPSPSMQMGTTILSPGSYQVYALTSVDGLEYANPEALRAYPSQTVTLQAGGNVELTVEPSERREN
jgi:hypothetical protein